MGSYKALYRKYRPTNFKTVVGQDYIIRTLKNSISKDHISHAYLFTGPRGVGKTTVARIFAKAINCTSRIDDEACESCEVCKQTNASSNPDIIEINASNQTGVNDMRDLLDKVVFLPTISKYKVYIIDEVHMLSSSSFNALLKTLEEPPKHAIFILCTTEVEKVIPTIRSRCQRYDFHLIEKDTIINRLDYVRKEESINISHDALSLIADASEGGMRDALSLLDQVSSFSVTDEITKDDVISVSGMLDFDSLLSIAKDVMSNSSTDATLELDNLIRSGKEVEKITSNLINFFKDILIIKNTNRKIDKVGYDTEGFINITNSFNNKDLFNYIEILSEASRDYRYSLDKRLYLELALIKMCDNSSLVKEEVKVKPTITNSDQSTKTEYNPNINYSFKKEDAPIIAEVKTETPKVEETKVLETKESDSVTVLNEDTPKEEDPFLSLFNNVNEDKDESIKEEKKEEHGQYSLFTEDKVDSPINEKQKVEEVNLFSMNLDEEKKVEPIQESSDIEVVQEEIKEEIREIYDIHFIEKVLNNADKPFKERIIVSLEKAIRESKGTDYYKYALLLDGSTIVASSRENMIITFNDVSYCNLIMKEENIKGVKDFFKNFMNIFIDYMAIPFDYWNTASKEFVSKFMANKEKNIVNYITLTPVECPGLNINVRENKVVKENKFQEIEDMFKDIIS